MQRPDFLVIGGGIVGLSLARELKKRHPGCLVALIEKEERCGLHASGRNSGVLHAGFYYTADSMKAKLTKQGNALLTEYCLAAGIPLNRCGKLVVAKDEKDLKMFSELLKRAQANGVELKEISAQEAQELEPRVLTYQKALFSPTTSSLNPARLMDRIREDALHDGVKIFEGVRYLSSRQNAVQTSGGTFEAGFVANAAGLYADRVARDFGFSERYRILPFRGLYLLSDEPAGSLSRHIYPVPDLNYPFLGVHFTVTADGRSKIGPTALPAFWRENYNGFENFKFSEFVEILIRDMGLLFFSGFDFKKLAWEELTKASARRMAGLASGMLQGVRPENYRIWGKPGLRAQLVDIKSRKLEMDFVVEGDRKSLHILNAVSPGLTCSMSFARHLCQTAIP